ncbi:unnamed protein product [Arctia plantaginis]|uniref:Translocator protein n=1 Tax=Arctia plantaginis TaxID=874455 RepID=A0A8S0ZJ26_ARCPL|nr:unnamed protein product [Arctia plantaginis]CAB3258580.1 unnamed protein product [Arctia plantaginis]
MQLVEFHLERLRDTIMANWAAIGSIVLPNVGGWANGMYFAGQIRKGEDKSWYDNLNKPSWNPPKYVFGPAWTVLYSSMGYASYLVYEECGGFTDEAVLPLALYGGQLLLNWAWTPIFFGLKDFKLALIEISVLTGAATATAISFASLTHLLHLEEQPQGRGPRGQGREEPVKIFNTTLN